MSERAGFVGLGIMGRSLARNLMEEAGHELMLYNRTRSTVDVLARGGRTEVAGGAK